MGAPGELRFRGHRQQLKRFPLRLRLSANPTARAQARAVSFR